MKKFQVLFFILSPVLLGYFYQCFVEQSHFDAIWFDTVAVAILVYWLFVGVRFARLIRNSFGAIISGNSLGILSFAGICLQFIFPGNIEFEKFSDLFEYFALPTYLFTNKIDGSASIFSFFITPEIFRNFIGLLGMIFIFSIGYFIKKSIIKTKKHARCVIRKR